MIRGPRTGSGWVPSPETFGVEEIARYDFCGEGEHAAVEVEKAGRTTRDIAVQVARRLGVPPSAVGYAGMKDKASVSSQGFTVTGADELETRQAFEAEGCRVLRVTRHRNKLRLGHLAGNRFRVFLPGIDLAAARAALVELARGGVPNYFGPQRFGGRGDNAVRGLATLKGELRASRWKRDLLVSALQSFVFNEVLARRVEEAALGAAFEGDVLRREDSGGLFVCDEPAEADPRVRSFAVSPTGPIAGRKMVRPGGRPAAVESAVLVELGLDPDLFTRLTGSRRPLRARVIDGSLEPASGGAWVSFTCPPGVYATSVIRELTPLGNECDQ
jgi:tRNA pseudouridine13 synthase